MTDPTEKEDSPPYPSTVTSKLLAQETDGKLVDVINTRDLEPKIREQLISEDSNEALTSAQYRNKISALDSIDDEERHRQVRRQWRQYAINTLKNTPDIHHYEPRLHDCLLMLRCRDDQQLNPDYYDLRIYNDLDVSIVTGHSSLDNRFLADPLADPRDLDVYLLDEPPTSVQKAVDTFELSPLWSNKQPCDEGKHNFVFEDGIAANVSCTHCEMRRSNISFSGQTVPIGKPAGNKENTAHVIRDIAPLESPKITAEGEQ